MQAKTGVVIHHSYGEPEQLEKYGSKMPGAFDWASLRRFHVEDPDRQYDDIGYAFGIDVDGSVIMGRSAQIDGAHCLGHNQNTIGVCLLGNFSERYVPLQQWTHAVQFVSSLCMLFNISPANVWGHREMSGANTECPGKHFNIGQFCFHVSQHMRMMTGNV